MHPELCDDERVRRLFEQEARIGHRISSDHVVQVLDAGIDETTGIPWLAMELLDGEDLAARLRRSGAVPAPEAAEILGQIGHALAAAHAVGVVHRDLKPENVFLSLSRRDGAPLLVKLLDFGVAKVIAEARPAGTLVGTPLWMAPEQMSGAAVSPATDVWALGLLAFWMLTGKPYWSHADSPLGALLGQLRRGPSMSASARAAELGRPEALPSGFDPWFARCVAPGTRFPDAGAARDALRGVLGGPPPPRPKEDLDREPGAPDPQPPGAAYDARWYVRREREEREALNALAFPGKPAVLWGPSRFGKTWLLDHCLERVRERDGFDTVLIHTRLFNRESLDSLLLGLASRIAEERDEKLDTVETIWRRPGTATTKLTRLLERHVLPGVRRGLVLAIDGVDEVWQSPFQDDFCALLRAWAESYHEPWPRLRLMLAVSTTPALLVSDPNRSPFNLSVPIVISDLTAAQVEELAKRHKLPWAAPEIERVMQLVGGHPHLVRLLMHRAALHSIPLPELLDTSLGARWVLHDDVLRMRRWLTLRGLMGIAARVAEDSGVALDPTEYERATRAGVVLEEAQGRLRLRNRLYEIAVVGRP
jgi:serine/threonine protein kinase